jgi:hypothetical protein
MNTLPIGIANGPTNYLIRNRFYHFASIHLINKRLNEFNVGKVNSDTESKNVCWNLDQFSMEHLFA